MKRTEWQGTAFVLWVLAAGGALFLLRHPAGRESMAGPYGGALTAGTIALCYLGWTLGWMNRLRLLGLALAVAVAGGAAVLRLAPLAALGLEAGLLFPYVLGGILARRTWAPLRLPEWRRPPVARPAPPEPVPPATASGPAPRDIPGWMDTPSADWPADAEPEGREVAAPGARGAPSELGPPLAMEPPGAASPERAGPPPDLAVLLPALPAEPERSAPPAEAGPGQPWRDAAVRLADSALDLLAGHGVASPALHLESGPGGVALELALSSRREGEAISTLRRAFVAACGAAPAESLHGQALRLTFPASARAGADRGGPTTLWAPLGRRAGRRVLANLLGVGPLLVVGEDTAAVVAAVHAIVGAALAGRLSPRPARVLLAEESGHYLAAYAGLAELHRGPEGVTALKDLAYERSRQQVVAPPVLAVVLLPSPGVQQELAQCATALAPAGVHVVVALDTPQLWNARELAVLMPARLVFRVGEAESRFFLGRPGAEELAAGQAIYHLAEALREPQVLQAYAASEEDVQTLVAALRAAELSAPREEETLTTKTELPEKVLAVLDAVLAVGRYSVRQVWDRVRTQRVSRQAVFEMEDLFEAAGVVAVPANPLGRRKVLVDSRAEALARLRAYLEAMQ